MNCMSQVSPVKVAMIGVGAISGIYLHNITTVFQEVDLVGICDLIPERAEEGLNAVRDMIKKGANAKEPKIYKDMYEAFNDPEVEVVLNLTRPYEHYEVSKQALLHGKHVYTEKPLGVDMEEASQLIGSLLQLEDPYHCPHGRPTMIVFSEDELEKKFKRIV